jgi:hypothetical protein
MGTKWEWVRVILFAVFCGGGMVGTIALMRRGARLRPLVLGREMVASLLMGVCLGIKVVFRGAAWSGAMQGISLVLFLAALVVQLLGPGKRKLRKVE